MNINDKKLQYSRSGVLPHYLSIVKPVRLINLQGLSAEQVAQLEQILFSKSHQLTETWLLKFDNENSDICLATHQSFYNNNKIIHQEYTLVVCTETEIKHLDYDFQIPDPIPFEQLIKLLNYFSQSLQTYALTEKSHPIPMVFNL